MKSKKIVVTRSEAQGKEFVSRFFAADADQFIFEPLLDVRTTSPVLPKQENYDSLLVTSVHGAEILLNAPKEWLDKDYYCVGSSVAEKLRELGCVNVESKQPRASDLVEDIKLNHSTDKKRFLYLRGQDVAYDLPGVLMRLGHSVDELICYEAYASDVLTNSFVEALKRKEISAIAFFSGRTASIFAKLVREFDIFDDLKGIKALCISAGVLECLHTIFDENIEVAESPDAQGMAAIIGSFLRNKKER